MRIIQYDNVDKFLERAGPLIYSKPVLYAQMVSIIETVQKEPNHYGEGALYALVVVDKHEQPIAAALRTPPFPLQVTELSDEAALALAEFFEEFDSDLPAVLGPGPDAWKFARAFCNTCRVPDLRLHMTLYALRQVEHPTNCAGTLRRCHSNEFEHIYAWMCDFADDCDLPEGRPPRERVQRSLDEGSYYYWEVDNEPVSLFRRVGGADKSYARISSVFTPVPWRGRGYGTSGTAALSQKCLDEGADYVTLYADVKNPTSNGIYQRVGYQHVRDIKVFEFQRD